MDLPADQAGKTQVGADVDSTADTPGRLTRWSRLFADTFGIVPAFMWRKVIRLAGVMLLDFVAVAGTFFLLLPFVQPRVSLAGWLDTLPLLAVSASALTVALLYLSGLYRRSWRFTSLADCIAMGFNIGFALAITWSTIWWLIGSPRSLGDIALLGLFHFCLCFLAMQVMRLSRRAVRFLPIGNIAGKNGAGAIDRKNVILVGPANWAESIIKFSKSEAGSPINAVGVLLPEADGPIVQIHNVQVLGFPENLPTAIAILEQRGRRPETIVVCDDAVNMSAREVASVTGRARDLGISVSRVGDDWGQLLGRDTAPNLDKLSTADLLGRREFELREAAISQQIAGEPVLVTGAGGTIGSELVRQLADFKPSKIVLLDHSEYGLYNIEKQIREDFPEQNLAIELCNIRNPIEVRRVFDRHKPAIVYHAAALKHVPIVEGNPCAGVHTNVIGTKNIADAVTEFSARAMVQVSTDKAVNPVGMMGATKRVGELYAQSLDLCGVDDPEAPRFMTVRFGNVLGSSGSVVPLFKRQLLAGGPLTVTHPDIERFFMTVREAVQLILESSSRALQENTPRGRIMVLDMGEPVKIVDLARRMIRIYGMEPDVDVAISFTGLRPGEKLFEELFDSCEEQDESDIPGIFEAASNPIPLPFITRAIEQLGVEVDAGNDSNVRRITHHLTTLPSSGDSLAGYVATSDAFLRSGRFKTVEEA
ncbi:MAG: polysaccharide biosynthesis protein [Pseudomonadota bacterium]